MNKQAKRRLALQAVALCWGAPAFAGAERASGPGAVSRQTRNPGPFTGVSLSIPAALEARLGPADSVTIEADARLLALIDTVVEDGTLKIRPARRAVNFNNATIRISVQARELKTLGVGGSGSIEVHGLRTPALQTDIGGSGSIRLHALETEALTVNVGGSGSLVAIGGNARRVAVGVGGSGNVKLDGLRVVHASVNLAGSGNVLLNVREVLKVVIAGSGDVEYHGDPQVSKTVAGSGTVRRLGPGR